MSNKNFNYCCLEGTVCGQKSNVVITKDESLEDQEESCPMCGKPMKHIGFVGHGGVAKFANMTPNERKQVLKKRSHEHFNREVKEQKREMLKASGLSPEIKTKK